MHQSIVYYYISDRNVRLWLVQIASRGVS